MINSVHINIGTLHHHLPESMWDRMAKEMHQTFECDVVFRTVHDNTGTKMRLDGDLSPDELAQCQLIFSKHIEKWTK